MQACDHACLQDSAASSAFPFLVSHCALDSRFFSVRVPIRVGNYKATVASTTVRETYYIDRLPFAHQ